MLIVRTAVFQTNPNESIEKLIRRFKRKVKTEGIFEDMKKNEFFEKPSAKRRLKRKNH